MTEVLTALVHPLNFRAWMTAEILPIVLFFGMFFTVYGLGGIVVRRLPRKSGSMLDEILNEEYSEDMQQTGQAQQAAALAPGAVEPEQPQTETDENTADECDGK